MKIIKAGYEILGHVNGEDVLRQIEVAGRTCYKSEDKITTDSAVKFVKMLIDRGHEAMIEHMSVSVKFTCDRGVTHEIVRHRLASYAQESTRYCNYGGDKFGNEITVIEPCFWNSEENSNVRKYLIWSEAMRNCERAYLELLAAGASPQEARSVLPNSLKTEIVVTMNLREWRHFFKLRTAAVAHPQMQESTRPLLDQFKQLIPVVFDDIDY